MGRIQFIDDVLGNFQETHGSDSRLNVSARSDTRGYYNSRDESESFTLLFDDANCTALDFCVHLQNTKTDGKHMVIRSASVNSDSNSAFDFVLVTGTAGGGAVAATPVNLNQAGVAKTATVTANTVVDSDANPITGLTVGSELDHVNVLANAHEEFRFQDQVRIGQDQAVGIRCKIGTGVSCFGIIFFYFE